ncbi:transglycosylase SLT domain-containing protein [Emcibacter sp. SYSU 3D8]|uniref:transglycosylase SLT domain-containing protein n=1 Tax=Emcibacter sp. SYSU 3D8 TaxID=3133969 RepID=UPI0031FF33B5
MKDRQVIRILVPYSKTLFFYDKDKEMGVVHDLGVSLEKWANQQSSPGPGKKSVKVVFVPVPEERLLSDLTAGLGDMAAGGLAFDDNGEIDFGGSLAPDSGSVLVSRKRGDPLDELDDLSGREVVIHRSSASFEPLRALSARLEARGKRPIKLIKAPEELQDEDLLQMVSGGLVQIAVVDGYVATFWSKIIPGIVVNGDLLDKGGTALGWAVRKNSPQLKRLLEGFTARAEGKAFAGGTSLRKYLGETRLPNNATAQREMDKFNGAIDMFKKYGDAYDFDHLMMMALGYQESGLNQKARNPYGPVGMMQITPATASTSVVAIKGIDKDANRNVEAAAKYLRYIADSYLDDPNISQMNRTLMAFVGYNAGPRKLKIIREAAAKSGLDPNVWFQNVELAAAQTLGRKSVEYVSNIYKYYTAYRISVGDPALRTRPNSPVAVEPVERVPEEDPVAVTQR